METRCTIERIARVRHRSASVRLTGRYHFEVGGARFVGSRVSVVDRLAGPAVFAALFTRLEAARASGRPVPCYVDPKDPRRSVIDRDLRPVHFLGSVVLFGCGLSFLSLAAHALREGMRQGRGHRGLRTAADRPWEAEPQWRALRCRPAVSVPLFGMLAEVLFLVTAIAFPFVFFPLPLRWQVAASAAAAGLFAGVIPWRAFHGLMRRRGFEHAALLLSAPCSRPGDVFRAELEMPACGLRGADLVARLVCSREVPRGGRFVSRLGRLDIGAVAVRVLLEGGMPESRHAVRVPLEIPVPADLPGTQRNRFTGCDIYWQLEVELDGGAAAGRTVVFDVPIFAAASGQAPARGREGAPAMLAEGGWS